jgi:predicted RNA-binding Zn-ribbon protein involved in translation (DUF1610 family)
MLQWLRDWWQRLTTNPCEGCGEAVLVAAYRKTGRTREGNWWAGGGVELECPHCGNTFWVKK